MESGNNGPETLIRQLNAFQRYLAADTRVLYQFLCIFYSKLHSQGKRNFDEGRNYCDNKTGLKNYFYSNLNRIISPEILLFVPCHCDSQRAFT